MTNAAPPMPATPLTPPPAPPAAMPAVVPPAGAIVLDQVSVRYQHHLALRHVSARFATGQCWAIVGANGSGKSTLLKAAMRLVHCATGSVQWQGLQRHDIAYLPQQSEIDRNLPVLVQDLVALGLWHELRWWRRLRREQWARVHAALQQVGMLAAARQPIAALSSGQFQRVLFARMLVQNARMLLLDEPFNAVDARTTADLLHVLRQCASQGAGVVAVVHDLEQARCHFDHILRLNRPASPADDARDADERRASSPATPATAQAQAAANTSPSSPAPNPTASGAGAGVGVDVGAGAGTGTDAGANAAAHAAHACTVQAAPSAHPACARNAACIARPRTPAAGPAPFQD